MKDGIKKNVAVVTCAEIPLAITDQGLINPSESPRLQTRDRKTLLPTFEAYDKFISQWIVSHFPGQTVVEKPKWGNRLTQK